MKKQIIWKSLLLVFLSSPALSLGLERTTCEIVKVLDAQTFEVRLTHGENRTITLTSVSAPRTDKAECDREKQAGIYATQFIQERIDQVVSDKGLIECEFLNRVNETEDYGDIFLNNTRVSNIIMNGGLAFYSAGNSPRWCKRKGKIIN